jgi:hypothetical protein
VGRCAGAGATGARRRRRFRHRRRGGTRRGYNNGGVVIAATAASSSVRRRKRTTTRAIGRAGVVAIAISRSRRPSFHEGRHDGRGSRRPVATTGSPAGGRATRSVRRLRDRRVADDDGGRRAATTDGDDGARRRRRRRRRPVGTRRPSSRRGRGGRRNSGPIGTGYRGDDPPDAIAGAVGMDGGPPSSGGGASRRDGRTDIRRRSRTTILRAAPTARPAAARDVGRGDRRRPPRECDRARGGSPPREFVADPPPGGPRSPVFSPPRISRPGGGDAFSPTMADRSSVAVRRRHPRSPLDQLLSEERLGRTTRRRSHSQSKEVALL